VDAELRQQALTARDRLIEAEHDADRARVEYHYAIRRLHAAGGSMREIAGELGLSHQRVHQIVDEVDLRTYRSPVGKPARQTGSQPPDAPAYDKMSGDAREALLSAQDEARSLNHGYIGTEHLLLGLLGVPRGVVARLLAEVGITAQDVRSAIDRIIGRGEREAPSSPLRLTPRSKKVLELALRESKRDRSTHVRGEHVLLGLLREGKGVGAQVLGQLGADPADVRKRIGHASLTCSFCSRTGLEVNRLVAGPGVYICDGCIGAGTALLDPDPGGEPAGGPLTVAAPDDESKCGFCGRRPAAQDRLVAGPQAAICGQCLALAREVESSGG
jgi:hypothetical protein